MTVGLLSQQALKEKQSRLDVPPSFAHRLHRCFSWLERSNSEDNADAKYIFLWIAFNAAYAIELKAEGGFVPEAKRRKAYFRRLCKLDIEGRIYGGLRCSLTEPAGSLMDNVYVFQGFWDCLDERPFDWHNWKKKKVFDADSKQVKRLLAPDRQSEVREAAPGSAGTGCDEDVVLVLVRVFDRLYVLRNQLMHGCATIAGSLNRRQVEDGAKILGFLVPLFLDIMMDNPDDEWGPISYPVRPDIREDRC